MPGPALLRARRRGCRRRRRRLGWRRTAFLQGAFGAGVTDGTGSGRSAGVSGLASGFASRLALFSGLRRLGLGRLGPVARRLGFSLRLSLVRPWARPSRVRPSAALPDDGASSPSFCFCAGRSASAAAGDCASTGLAASGFASGLSVAGRACRRALRPWRVPGSA